MWRERKLGKWERSLAYLIVMPRRARRSASLLVTKTWKPGSRRAWRCFRGGYVLRSKPAPRR